MRRLVSCVVLSFFCMGLSSSGWAQREVPPPTDLPADLRPATSSNTVAKPAPSEAAASHSAAASAPVAAKPQGTKAAKTALAKKSGPAPAAEPARRSVQAETRQPPKGMKTAQKNDHKRTAAKKPAASKVAKEKSKAAPVAKKNPPKKVHRAGIIPGE